MIKELNNCLKEVGIQEEFTSDNIIITSRSVIIKSDSNIHQLLEDYMYPPIEELEVFHYTSEEAYNNIINNQQFRLYNILKRYGEGELSPFLKKFGFDEAFDTSGNIKNIEFYQNIFYASFIKVPEDGIDTEEMKYFDKLCETRLKFKITSTKNTFRKIRYSNDEYFTFFLKLKEIINNHGKKFIIEGMSTRFATFCIDDNNEIENEYRIYWRYWDTKTNGLSVKKDNEDNNYISLDFNMDNFTGIKIELIE